VRVGALGNAENALALCDELAERVVPIVFDPVARASDGGWLYRGEHDALAAMNAIVERLHPIITPNIAEAGTLGEVDIWDLPSQIRAGSRLIDKGAASALVKGGHVPGDPVDVLVTADNVETFSDTRLPQKMRGTGCTLAMALACEIALGRDLVTAVKGARAYVRANIARS
jgi:hydroxymethylpyrimidine/phosphomethylpyrimidine kinase